MSTKLTETDVDPILAEIHQTRQQLLLENGGLEGLAEFLRKQDAKRESTDPNRKITRAKDDSPGVPEGPPQ